MQQVSIAGRHTNNMKDMFDTMEMILGLFLLIVGLGESMMITCGYQQCNSSFETCQGKREDYNSLRCYKCSDYIRDVQTDCVGKIGKECSEYCIETLQKLITKERLLLKEKEESLQLLKRNCSSSIEKENTNTNTASENYKLFQIGTVVFLPLFVIFLSLYCFERLKQRRNRKACQLNENSSVTHSSTSTSFDSENESTTEGATSGQDRLQQVKPKQINGTEKVVPTGGKSIQNLPVHVSEYGDENQSFLKEFELQTYTCQTGDTTT